jgi:large subunit ribosomal protein L17
MAISLFQHGAIRTTETKAKQLRGFVEKLITTARKGTLHARRQVIAQLGGDQVLFDDEGEMLEASVVEKLFDEIAPRYADRPGGYTRILHLAERRIGDAGRQCLLQLVEEGTEAQAVSGDTGRKRRAAKRHEAASAAPAEQAGEAAAQQEAASEEAEHHPAAEEPAPGAAEDAAPDASEEASDSDENDKKD